MIVDRSVLYQDFERSDPPAGKGGGPITKLGGNFAFDILLLDTTKGKTRN